MTSSQTPVQPVVCRVLVSGRVQGVGYRYALAACAQDLNIAGWCRNLPDGRVEACLQGAPDAIERLVAWMRQGPPKAVVEHLEIEPVTEPNERFFAFEIRR
jgi:acylphosphatase